MPSFFEGLLLVFMIFGFCVGIAILIKVGALWMEQTKTAEKEQPQESKIYLVKQTSNTPQPKPKTKRRRSPKIAFEGLVLKPEKVSLSQEESPPSQEPKQSKISF